MRTGESAVDFPSSVGAEGAQEDAVMLQEPSPTIKPGLLLMAQGNIPRKLRSCLLLKGNAGYLTGSLSPQLGENAFTWMWNKFLLA